MSLSKVSLILSSFFFYLFLLFLLLLLLWELSSFNISVLRAVRVNFVVCFNSFFFCFTWKIII